MKFGTAYGAKFHLDWSIFGIPAQKNTKDRGICKLYRPLGASPLLNFDEIYIIYADSKNK